MSETPKRSPAATAVGGDPPRRRGRPALVRDTALTDEVIVDTAYRIMVEDGLDELSMRRLSDDLGVTVKAIYNHIANKAALMQRLVDRVWEDIFAGLPPDPTDLLEWSVLLQLRTRNVWLENLDLATLGMAVSEPDEILLSATNQSAQVLRLLGAQDVGLLYNVLQTYTFGSIAVAANRRRASRYFGRDPAATLRAARELAASSGASADALEVLEARFDEGDEQHFETGLRLIIAALLAVPAKEPPAQMS